MSFNGSGTFNINTAGQPVVDGTAITSSVFNALTADIASGLSTCVTKDGQTTPTANLPMGGFKLTGLALGLATTDSARMDNAVHMNICEGRISVDTAAVQTSDVSGFTITFYPFRGSRIALYNGTQWVLRTIASPTISVPATTNTNYDVFAYDNSGTVTLELVAWSTDTARATNITTQDGVYVKSGATTRRYLGTVRTGSSVGFVPDTEAQRYCWNYYNRLPRPMKVVSTSNWTYTTATYRQANASTTNQLDCVIGVSEEPVEVTLATTAANTSAGVAVRIGIGLGSTTASSATMTPSATTQLANTPTPINAYYRGWPGAGRRYFPWLEFSTASGTTTWNSSVEGGLIGTVWG